MEAKFLPSGQVNRRLLVSVVVLVAAPGGLAGSRAAIEREVGVAPIALAYPAGEYDARAVAAAAQAGFLVCVITHEGTMLEVQKGARDPSLPDGVEDDVTEHSSVREVLLPKVRLGP